MVIRRGWTLLQMKHKGDYWPKPQAFVEAIGEAKKEQIMHSSVLALPKPKDETRYGNEIDEAMKNIFAGSRYAIEMLDDGLINYIYEDVKFRKINGPQDVDQRYRNQCHIRNSEWEDKWGKAQGELMQRFYKIYQERRDNLTKKWRAITESRHYE